MEKRIRALETLKGLNFCGTCTSGICKECDRKNAKDMTLIALEKQIPKEVTEVYRARIEELPGKHILSGGCSECGCGVPHKHWYCWSCGQRLKWPELLTYADTSRINSLEKEKNCKTIKAIENSSEVGKFIKYDEMKLKLKKVSLDADRLIKIIEAESRDYCRRMAFMETTYSEILKGADYSQCETIEQMAEVYANSILVRLGFLDYSF